MKLLNQIVSSLGLVSAFAPSLTKEELIEKFVVEPTEAPVDYYIAEGSGDESTWRDVTDGEVLAQYYFVHNHTFKAYAYKKIDEYLGMVRQYTAGASKMSRDVLPHIEFISDLAQTDIHRYFADLYRSEPRAGRAEKKLEKQRKRLKEYKARRWDIFVRMANRVLEIANAPRDKVPLALEKIKTMGYNELEEVYKHAFTIEPRCINLLPGGRCNAVMCRHPDLYNDEYLCPKRCGRCPDETELDESNIEYWTKYSEYRKVKDQQERIEKAHALAAKDPEYRASLHYREAIKSG